MESIRKLYLVAILKVNGAHLGDPASRRRVYFVLVRRQGAEKCFFSPDSWKL